MKAAFILETGSPDKIQYADLPEPEIGDGQVLVRVGAMSVNPIDTYIRGGANYWELPRPYIVGCDLAGTVVQVSPDVKGFQPGDRVWGSNQGLLGRQGCFSELAAIDAHWLYPTPNGISDTTAAACALVGITAHLGLVQRAQLKVGETLFIRGGAGGVGSMVVQMAKAMGARVIATAGGPHKAELCRRLGADHVIDYRSQDIAKTLMELAPQGVNVFWETLRDPDFDLAVQCMAQEARMVLMAGRTARPAFPVGPFYVKGCTLVGFAMFNATHHQQRLCAQDINHWLTNQNLTPLVDRVMPLSQTAEAHRLQQAHTVDQCSSLTGKLVLQPDAVLGTHSVVA
ncbi:MAG: NADPH:quinone reductase [Pirellulaceae bacterium]|nr:NADPH:quinone reductase [Pirellulaceae bacterium]